MTTNPNRKQRRAAGKAAPPAPPSPADAPAADPRTKDQILVELDNWMALANDYKAKRDQLEIDLFNTKQGAKRLGEQLAGALTKLGMAEQKDAAKSAQPAAPAAQHEEPIDG